MIDRCGGFAALGVLVASTATCDVLVDAHFDEAHPGATSSNGPDAGPGATGAGGAGTTSGSGGQGRSCPAGFDECDGDPTTVCETDLTTSLASCGACDQPCAGTCVGATCLAPPDGAILWLRSDVGLTPLPNELSWVDQISGKLAVASDSATGAGSVPLVETSIKFNGHSVVHFDGDDDRIRLPSIEGDFTKGFTAAFVMRVLAPHTWDGWLFLGREDAGKYVDAIAVCRELDWEHRLRFAVQGVFDPNSWWDGVVQAHGGLPTLPPEAQILVVEQRPDDASTWFYANGASVPKNWGDSALPTKTLRDASYLGWVPNGAFEGEIAEVVLYERAVDDTERFALEAYLANKYAVPLVAPCAGDCPLVLARGQGIPNYVAASGSRIVWTNAEGGEVATIDDVTVPTPAKTVSGGGVTAVQPSGPSVDATYFYWGDDGWTIHRLAIDGGPAESTSASGEIMNVAIDSTTAFASLRDGQGISQVPKSAWSPVSTQSLGKVLQYVAVDDTHVYYSAVTADPATEGVWRVPKGAIDVANAVRVAAVTQPKQIVIDATHLYVASEDSAGHVVRVDKASLATATLASLGATVGGIASDGQNLYFTDFWGGTVNRVPVAGGPVTTVVDGQAMPAGIVVVDDWLVWANRDGTIVRIAKPAP